MALFSGWRRGSVRWRTRVVLWGFAATAGLLVAAFARLADLSLKTFFSLYAAHGWAPLVLGPAVGMSAVWMTKRYFPGIEGSGIPQVIAATRLARRGQSIGHLVSFRIALGKVMLGMYALAGGFSAGREGPSVQVAASTLELASRWLPLTRAIPRSDLILAGGAAGVAAAFNTPLAGIVFAVEELGKRLETGTSGVLMSTIILSGLLSIAVLGNYNYFGQVTIPEVGISIVGPILACALTCGLLGGLFSRLMLWPQREPGFLLWRWRSAYPVRFAGACGLVMALIGYAGGGLSFGSGYSVTEPVVQGEGGLPWHAFVTRFLATLISYYSGIPGGIFAPALAVGAGVGSDLGLLAGFPEHSSLVGLVMLGMAGFLAAVTQAPITSAIIVMEMVSGHQMVLSLMAVALLSSAVSAWLGGELYQQLAQSYDQSHEPKEGGD